MATHPAYLRIRKLIRDEIAAAASAGSPYHLPTERELEARYGVSRPTVSKALAGLAAEGLLVKPPGCRRLVVASEAAGRLSVRRRDHRIGLVTGDLSRVGAASAELAHRVFAGMNAYARRADCRVLMGAAEPTVASERSAAHDLVSAGVSGVVIWPCPRRADEVESDYLRTQELGVPAVLLDTTLTSQRHTQIVFDNRRAGTRVTRWLIEQGHRRIALITLPGDLMHTPVARRREGYEAALEEAGLPWDPDLVGIIPLADYTGPGGRGAGHAHLAALVDRWLMLDEPPTAIIGLEDSIAMEIIGLLQDRGVRVPDDVMVTGFDNLEAGRRFRPSFPTTAPDFVRMGELALETLLEEIEQPEPLPRVFVLDVPLIIRSADSVSAGTTALRAASRNGG